jgi:hypothetical protein
MKKALRLLPFAIVAGSLVASPAAAQPATTAAPAVELKQDLLAQQGSQGQVGRARLVPESVHRRLNGRMQLAP